MRKQLFFTLLLFGSLLFSQQDENPFPEEPKPSNKLEDNPNTEVVILDGIDFAFDTYRALSKGTEGNFVFSPYGLSSSMAMVFNGTAGSTQKQMVKGMHFKVRQWFLNDAFQWLAERYVFKPQETGSDILLSVSNALWTQRGIQIRPEFQTLIQAFYLNPIRNSNFAQYPELARTEINSWISQRTKGRMNEIFEAKQLTKDLRLLLISATYLRAKWANQFDPRVTRGVPFFPGTGQTIIVPTMVKTSYFSYVEAPDFTMIELPYTSRRAGLNKLSMLVILPKEAFGLNKAMDKFGGDSLQSWWNLMQPAPVIVSIPRFQVTSSFTMNGVFQAMGMTSLFSPGADLSEMSTDTTLYLDKMFHKASIGNDEAGSDAGTPYAVALPPLSSENLSNPKLFTADHPFLFLIVDREAKTVLFMGRVAKP